MADDTLFPDFTITGSDGKVDLWPPIPPMSYAQANEIGRERAAEVVQLIRRANSPSLLGHMADAIANCNRFGGLEVGFFHGISLELINPSLSVTEFIEIPNRQIPISGQMGHLRVVAGGRQDR
jgi:hypothetical protein